MSAEEVLHPGDKAMDELGSRRPVAGSGLVLGGQGDTYFGGALFGGAGGCPAGGTVSGSKSMPDSPMGTPGTGGPGFWMTGI